MGFLLGKGPTSDVMGVVCRDHAREMVDQDIRLLEAGQVDQRWHRCAGIMFVTSNSCGI